MELVGNSALKNHICHPGTASDTLDKVLNATDRPATGNATEASWQSPFFNADIDLSLLTTARMFNSQSGGRGTIRRAVAIRYGLNSMQPDLQNRTVATPLTYVDDRHLHVNLTYYIVPAISVSGNR